ncbi:MAG: rRNA pseudouridine synthase [Cryomorphaceae bacterium]|nr:rRNA pseudouridine synthase [Cryomorphaceae bacterium]
MNKRSTNNSRRPAGDKSKDNRKNASDKPRRPATDKYADNKKSPGSKSRGATEEKRDPDVKLGKNARKKAIFAKEASEKKFVPKSKKPALSKGKKRTTEGSSTDVRLNRYIATAGICSRREADVFIAAGLVEVNGKIITEMGFQVKPGDKVKYNGELIRGEKKRYVLLNKPKGFITTTDDPKARKTVMELVANACTERIYPVGRLDRATTGLLLFTNDGDLAKRLTHPSHGAAKIYEVVLNKNLSKSDFAKIVDGITLEDGDVLVDELSWVEGKARTHVGIRIHIGRNRIVRRLFESLGYEVVKLDRVFFAGLTKKNLPRGNYRHLSQLEIDNLHIKIK